MTAKSKQIIRTIAAKHNLQPVDLLKPGRFPHIVAARREAMIELKALGWSSFRIGAELNLDHTTVLHHVSPSFRARRIARYPAKQRRQRYAAEVSA